MNKYVKTWGLVGALALATALPACKEEPPSPAKLHVEAGDKHRIAKEWKQAAEEYGKSLEADPKQDKIWETKAYCHQQEQDMEGTVATLTKWAETKSEPAEKAKLHRSIAAMWMQKPDMAKAEASFLEAVKIHPTDDESLSWLGEIHSQRGGARDGKADAVPAELDKALEFYDKVAKIKPDKPETYINQRVIMSKYVKYHTKQQEAAEAEAKAFEKNKKEKDKVDEATARAEKHKAAIDEYKKKIEAATAKFTEAKKKAEATTKK